MDGSVQPDGIDLTYLNLPVEETFFRMLRHREFDVAEMSLSSYTVSLFREPRPFVAIPVFPSRFFRHSCIYVNAERRHPRAEGPDRQAHRHARVPDDGAGVDPRHPRPTTTACRSTASTYCTGGEEEPGRDEKIKLDLPPNIRVQPIGQTQTLAQMLASGEIDALHTARMPSTFASGDRGKVSGCSETTASVEQQYFRDTGIFPIMHTVVIRRDVYEQNRWIAQSLYKAFVEAQAQTYDDLYVTAALKAMLPWLTAHVEETRALMGDDFWPYGFARNRQTLATFLRYHHEQGLSKRLLAPEELFAPEAMESFKI